MKWLLVLLILPGCTTTFVEFKGECVMQEWQLVGYPVRTRQICDLPPPDDDEVQVRDREPMDVNPYPDLFDFKNDADTIDPNLLEKTMEYPQDDE